ncbi:dynein regulatory complex subunit 2 [Neocloeon triangulifer]|uniref:dynein regulatory complex subunit 2 n=1 Tax=Neocloeon triangulifer TaxID=2078957 RepID=UPI00286F6EA8|nr:dynein regulatory complex subunit 2 [Neocloeon triangulifer]
MAPKKKGKQNKLAKMSDEERLRYLQHKATQEEEARRRKQQLVANFVKIKLNREDAFTRINQAKLHEHWRHVLRKAKCKEIKQELERSKQIFGYMLERKERKINSLMKELEETEKQHLIVIQAHIEDVDKKILFGAKRVADKFKHYEEQREILLQISKTDAEEEKRRSDKALEFLNAVLFATEQNAEKIKQGIVNKASNRRTDTIHSYMEEIQSLQLHLQNHHDTMKEQLQSVFAVYNAATLDQRRMYEEMKERDAENLRVIGAQSSVISSLQSEIEKLQKALANTELTPRTQKLQNQEKDFAVECWRHRKRQQNATKIDEMAMRSVTVTGQKVVEHLEKIAQKGENIIKLASMCYKFETDEEKTIVGLKPNVLSNGQEMETLEHETERNLLSDMNPAMEHFWRRHCQALLSRVALRMHQDALLAENNKMRNSLKHYLTGASLASSSNLSSSQLMLSKQIRGRRISVLPQ